MGLSIVMHFYKYHSPTHKHTLDTNDMCTNISICSPAPVQAWICKHTQMLIFTCSKPRASIPYKTHACVCSQTSKNTCKLPQVSTCTHTGCVYTCMQARCVWSWSELRSTQISACDSHNTVKYFSFSPGDCRLTIVFSRTPNNASFLTLLRASSWTIPNLYEDQWEEYTVP